MGEEGLRSHLLDRALWAHGKYPDLDCARIGEFLIDPGCLRYPARLVFDFGDMAPHQFVQPGPTPEDPASGEMEIFVHPALRLHEGFIPAAVAYAVPQINYGDAATDEHCLLYGATLLGVTADEYYARLCTVADAVGAAARYRT
mgnify:CR=1 FL=1